MVCYATNIIYSNPIFATIGPLRPRYYFYWCFLKYLKAITAFLFHLYTTRHLLEIVFFKPGPNLLWAASLCLDRTRSDFSALSNCRVPVFSGDVYLLNKHGYILQEHWIFVYYLYNLSSKHPAQKIEISVIGSYLSQIFYWHRDCN